MFIAQTPSPNFEARKDGKKPSLIVLHYTDLPSAFESLKIMQDPAHKASAHYLVDEDGQITQLVPEDMRAWHAGASWWNGETDVNSISIGIEIQNAGHRGGCLPYPQAQIAAVTTLCKDIMQRHGIAKNNVIGHSDIAPARKIDPGEWFPWGALAMAGVGIWPEVSEEDEFNADQIVKDEDEIKSLLCRFGYDSRLDLKTLATAFQRHFSPDAFQSPDSIGKMSLNDVQMLCALYRQKLALRVKIVP